MSTVDLLPELDASFIFIIKVLTSFTWLHMRVSGSQEHRRFGIFVVSHGGRLTYSKTFAYSQGRTRVHGAEPLNVASLPFFTSGK